MSNQQKYFATHGHAGMRLALQYAARTTPPCHHTTRAVAAFARVRSCASVLRPSIRRHCTPSDKLPQLPQLALKKLGQLKPNNGGLPRLPQPAPPVFNMNRNGKEAARCVWGAGRESTSRQKSRGVQRNRATLTGPPRPFPSRVIRTSIIL